jgi:maltose-binding protein MalE
VALAAWQDQSLQSQLNQISQAAAIVPSNDLISTLGPLLKDAVAAVMNGQRDASQAAGQAVERLKGP